MPVLICMVGLPRSGKSTIAKQLSKKHNAPIVCRDDIRLALHGRRFVSEAEPFVKAISDIMIRSLFKSGHEVIVCDETNFSRRARDYHRSDDWDTVFFEVDTPSSVCKQRAVETRQGDLIPVINSMDARKQPLDSNEIRYQDKFGLGETKSHAILS